MTEILAAGETSAAALRARTRRDSILMAGVQAINGRVLFDDVDSRIGPETQTHASETGLGSGSLAVHASLKTAN